MLTFRVLAPGDLDTFESLVTDRHVLRFLFDGERMSRRWCADAIATSQRMLEERGVGLWLVFAGDTPAGFAGYWIFPEVGPEIQLLYALREAFTGRGYATEIGRELIRRARLNPGFEVIHSAVDEPNVASMRVLEKLGFVRTGTVPGAFGEIVLFELRQGS